MRSDTPSPIAGLNFRAPEALASPRINASGQVTFVSLVSGPGVTTANNRVLWATTPSGIQPAARQGSQAAGITTAGVNYLTLDGVAAINDAGQVVFGSTLTGTGVTGINDRGLWGGTPGNISLIAREGDVVDLDPGAGELLRTIQSISFANGFSSPVGSSASAALNDAGQVAWQAVFTAVSGGGTAVFLTTLPAQPGDDLDGDYNDDGIVDAADYVVWRKFDTTSTDLPNDPNPLPIDIDQYNTWRAHFNEADPGNGSSNSVPEPTVLVLAATIAMSQLPRQRHYLPRQLFERLR
jgi:hypothetical protein